ncbi:anionic trypsin-2-like isoform X2 [Hermetia illucens]|uniref:anionic trypsin-2-like isoform X2 n=1 Tax=Hermetia illucens TaxID=343691 RepID=UPI0018CC684E|nr:anionic trypsin-2-like isoform X2 [Hermetia illucens]
MTDNDRPVRETLTLGHSRQPASFMKIISEKRPIRPKQMLKYCKLIESLLILVIVSGSYLSDVQVPVGKYPGMVYIHTNINNETHICGGSLINSEFVLTITKCLKQSKREPEFYQIIGGDYNYDINLNGNKTTRQTVHAAKFFINRGSQNSLALIQLARPIQINEYFRPIELVQANPPSDAVCTVVGWNLNATGEQKTELHYSTQFLLVTDVFLVPMDICENSQGTKLNTEKFICAESLEENQGKVQGVEGAQLLCNGKLAGVVFCGIQYMHKDLPCAYLSIPYYSNWIYKTAGRGDDIKITKGGHRLQISKKSNGLTKKDYVNHKFNILYVLIIFEYVL